MNGEPRPVTAVPAASARGASTADEDLTEEDPPVTGAPGEDDGGRRADDASAGRSDRRGRSGRRPTLLRWLTENRADTRLPGPPEGRRYLAPFADVWDELREMIEEHDRWQLEHADETRGLMAATCRSRVFGFVDDLTIWLRLDADGLTEVAMRSRSRTGRGDFGVNRRRLERILEHLDGEFRRV